MNIREPHHFQKIRAQRQQKLNFLRIKRYATAVLILLITVALLGYASYVRALPVGSANIVQPTFSAKQVALNWPSKGQAAVGVMGVGVLASTGATDPLPTASVAKIMVALAVLRKHPLQPGQTGPLITITQSDVNSYNEYLANGGSVVPVAVGQKISQYQAMQALLLPSANNFAYTLARWSYGSLANYTTVANQIAQELGMSSSHFADASGFAPETVSTPQDLVLLGQAALKEPIIKAIVSQASAQISGVGTVYNTNGLLGYAGINGIKTGNTDQAGGCYLFSADHTLANDKKITVIGAVMGAPTLLQALRAAKPILDSFYSGFGYQHVVSKGQKLATYSLPWGGQVDAVGAQDLSVYGWLGSAPTVKVNAHPLNSKAQPGEAIGTINAETAFSSSKTTLILKQPIPQPSVSWRLTRG